MVRINLDEIRSSLEELHSHNIVFEGLEHGLYEENLIDNYDYVKLGFVISEIREKANIVNKLKSMSHNVNLLDSIVSARKYQKHQSFVTRIIENNLDSMNSIIEDLSLLKNNLDELESLNRNLLSSKLPIDVKILLEQNFERKHKKLNEIYAKQKNALVNLSVIFIGFARKALSGRR